MKTKLGLYAATAVIVGALALMANGCGSKCDSSNCTGCCDSSGSCQLGTATAECGKGGAACAACATGQQCVLQMCAFPGGGTSGNGSGNTSSGGSTGATTTTTTTSSGSSSTTSSGSTTTSGSTGNTTSGTTGTTTSGTTGTTTSGTTGGTYCTATVSVNSGDMGTACNNPDGGFFQGSCGTGEYCFDAFGEGQARCIAICQNYFQPCTVGGLCFPYSNGPDAGYTGICGKTCSTDANCPGSGYQCYPIAPNNEPGDCLYTGGGQTVKCTQDAQCGGTFKCDTVSGACYEPCTGGTACAQGGCCAHTSSFDYCDIEQP